MIQINKQTNITTEKQERKIQETWDAVKKPKFSNCMYGRGRKRTIPSHGIDQIFYTEFSTNFIVF